MLVDGIAIAILNLCDGYGLTVNTVCGDSRIRLSHLDGRYACGSQGERVIVLHLRSNAHRLGGRDDRVGPDCLGYLYEPRV